jgi:ribose transport system ATP-binding protein
VLLLDEITAALPANLTERVLQVVQRQGSDRSVIFISHRLIEIAAICNRATVLRNGETVGVVDVTAGSEDRIVDLMLGEGAAALGQREESALTHLGRGEQAPPRVEARSLGDDRRLHDATFDLYPGEVLGVVALEGQGQDELFDILSGAERPATGALLVDGKPVTFRHPADAIRLGMVYIAADRAEALLMQRSVRENISLPFSARVTRWGWINMHREGQKVDEAVDTLQIDARAGAEVRRLSGGNQQKVTIARWVASGVKTLLCFDPTRGIDIRTKTQIYVLLRDLAAAGASILLYTSELKEIQLACDRVIVIFGGRVVGEMPAAGADEVALLRAAHNLKPGAELPEEVVAAASADPSLVEAAVERSSAESVRQP